VQRLLEKGFLTLYSAWPTTTVWPSADLNARLATSNLTIATVGTAPTPCSFPTREPGAMPTGDRPRHCFPPPKLPPCGGTISGEPHSFPTPPPPQPVHLVVVELFRRPHTPCRRLAGDSPAPWASRCPLSPVLDLGLTNLGPLARPGGTQSAEGPKCTVSFPFSILLFKSISISSKL
jgi:hypothetical protein